MLDGRYEVERRLAGDDERNVSVALDKSLGRRVVLKSWAYTDDEGLAALRRQSGVVMSITPHPNIPVARHDFIDCGHYYLAIDHVEGVDLADVVRVHGNPGLAFGEVLRTLDDVASALDHLHAQRQPIVHGDLKPENIVIAPDGRAIVIDLGAALPSGRSAEQSSPSYGAPEAMAGESMTPAADVYSLAAVATMLLTGTPPHWGSPSSPDGEPLSEAVLDVLRHALSFDPARRPQSAGELVRRLREAAEADIPSGLLTVLRAQVDVDHIERAARSVKTDVQRILARHAGVPLVTAHVPTGSLAAVFRNAGEALAGAWEIADLVGVRGGDVRIGLHIGDVGGWRGQPVQELVDALDPLLARTPATSVACSPAAHRVLTDTTDHRSTPFCDGYLLTRAPSAASLEESLQRAFDLLESGAPDDALALAQDILGRPDAARCSARARLVVGQVLLALGRSTEARNELRQAAIAAEKDDDGATFARAAIVAARLQVHSRDNPELRAFVDVALEQVPADEPYLIAELRICSAALRPPGQPHDRRMAIARQALAHTNRLSVHERARIELNVSRACWNPDDAQHRLDVATSVLGVGDLIPSELRAEAFGHRAAARLQLRDVDGSLSDTAAGGSLAQAAGHRFLLARLRLAEAAVAVLQERHDEAARLAADAVELSNGRPNTVIAREALHWASLRAQCRHEEIRDLGRQLEATVDRQPLTVSCLALGLAEAGDLVTARRLLNSLPAVRTWPRDWFWLGATRATLAASEILDDALQVRRLTILLARYQSHLAVAGAGILCVVGSPLVDNLASGC
jgi:tetratricopeptide (TPR) repeat protein